MGRLKLISPIAKTDNYIIMHSQQGYQNTSNFSKTSGQAQSMLPCAFCVLCHIESKGVGLAVHPQCKYSVTTASLFLSWNATRVFGILIIGR